MDRDRTTETLFSVVAAFVVALVLSPVVRSFTVELNHSVGQVWPFSMSHCHVASTPGCAGAEVEARSVAPLSRKRLAQR